jgi:hypothetical protein
VKTWNVEIQRVKAMSNGNGLIRAQIDALVQPAASRDDGVPTTLLQFSEETARVMLLLLKTQLAEFDARKAKSRR